MIEHCVICGKPFEKKNWNQITCSPECGQIRYRQGQRVYHARKRLARRKQQLAELQAKQRARLNRPFAPLNYLKDDEAQALIIKKINLAAQDLLARPFCHTCGQDFTPKFKGEKYCSDECRHKSPLWRILITKYHAYGADFS